MIHFKVLTPVDNTGIPEVLAQNLEEFYYILSDPFVIIKEIVDGYPESYRLFHLDKQLFWMCESIEGLIYRDLPESHLVQSEGIIIDTDEIKYIFGIPAFKCQVILDKGKDTLTAWQTEKFGMNFSTIGTLPGIPLYYEKYWGKQKLEFMAHSIDTVWLSSDFFNVVPMPVFRSRQYVPFNFLEYIDESNVRRGKHFPFVSANSIQGRHVKIPLKGTPMLICFLRTHDAPSGFAEIVLNILNSYKDSVACVVVCDMNITSAQTYLPALERYCPVLMSGDRIFDRVGIGATAFFVVIDSGGFIDEIIFPQIKEWEEMLSFAIKRVQRNKQNKE